MTDNLTGMVDELFDDESDKQNEWEVEFIQHMQLKLAQKRTLSARERNKIDEIWQRVFG